MPQDFRPEDLPARVEAWKQVIQTQMHFNDLSVRSRQLGLTFVVATLGLSVVIVLQFPDAGLNSMGRFWHVSGFLTAACILAIMAVRTLDLGVYHRMLRGSVAFQQAADAKGLSQDLFGMPDGMTKYISAYSRSEGASFDDAGKVSMGSVRTAANKVSLFYWSTKGFLLAVTLLIFFLVEPSTGASGSGAEK
ncbi:hypothetical protein F1654_01320 [Alkalicaulis satelles]|uniref:Uncharacterized protein n=1 Tax=Alkalicaulis satelles TaxID=2609175 RepID=A0A5M6ZIM3_9PROT|nr:hypothetical protein [Alkalicaulis satelles]KAA5804673.1 hypothetical protein F1654_01320 [Alkalicaulis satelles]